MKKTLIINIGNSIVHLEEDAYEMLTIYLNEIKQHFAKNADDFEIVTDIENRIAEMFVEILQSTQKKVIELQDVQAVIGQMGRVQDFETEEEEIEQGSFATNFPGQKKLYRDSDDGVIAGVCAGLGHYLKIETRWIRLVAFLAIFLGGSGILAYVILWIAMPRANTRSEKMEMKGEATNLHGFQRNFEEELASFKHNMKNANDHFQPLVKQSKGFIREFIEVVGKVLGGTGKLVVKVIAGSFIVAGFGVLVGLVITLTAFLGLWESNAYEHFPFTLISEDFREPLAFGAFVVVFIPILALILFAVRVAFNKIAINRTLSFALLIIWLVGVSTTVYYVAKISSDFQEHAELVQNTNLKSFPAYVIDIDQSMAFSRQDSSLYHLNEVDLGGRVVVNNDVDHPFRPERNVRIDIEKSDVKQVTLVQTYEAKGKTFRKAIENAQNINYKFSQKDSVITMSPRLYLKKESAWRNQEVRVTLKVPVGTRLMLNHNVTNFLNFYHYSCQEDHQPNSSYSEWIMTEEGLKCKRELMNNTDQTP